MLAFIAVSEWVKYTIAGLFTLAVNSAFNRLFMKAKLPMDCGVPRCRLFHRWILLPMVQFDGDLHRRRRVCAKCGLEQLGLRQSDASTQRWAEAGLVRRAIASAAESRSSHGDN